MMADILASAGGEACTLGCLLLVIAVVWPMVFVGVAYLTMKHRWGA